MNQDDSIPEEKPEAGIQDPSTTAEHHPLNAFEGLSDEKELSFEKNPPRKHELHEHLLCWLAFWCVTWGGTTLAGGCFGGTLGMIGILESPVAPLYALVGGLMWAGGVGLFVFLHLGVICWTFWWLGRPIVVATVAGFVVGAICGMLFLSLITAPLGAVGAYFAGNNFLKTKTGKAFQATIESARTDSGGQLRFTTKDLLLRMTVISVMIAGWTSWLSTF